MTRGSIQEYTEAVRQRYLRASKKGKGTILDEFVNVTGYHRRSAIRLLRRKRQVVPWRRRGRSRQYGPGAVEALKVAWEVTDRICSRRLQPFLPELVKVLRRYGEKLMTAEVEVRLCQMSPSTIDRLLRPYRRLGGRRHFSITKPGSLLKHSIPIRTFAEWEENCPGFLEVDLVVVAHCGESTFGFYLTTLSTVDVATGWSECVGVWGKSQMRVGGAVHEVRRRLPFPLLGLDSDSGSEFINQHLYDYCQRNAIKFTRPRPYEKNDSCHVEQNNWTVARRLIGYDPYNSRAALETLNRLYYVTCHHVNFFQPVMKLVAKTTQGAKVRKVYDTARTPYYRLPDGGVLTEHKRQELAATYRGLNPVLFLQQINGHPECLRRLAERPVRHNKASSHNSLATAIGDATMPVG